MQRSGKNIGRYFGETIDIARILTEIKAAAANHGWRCDSFPQSSDRELIGLTRLAPNEKFRIYISTGIHGDEPAGPLAALQLLQENQWPEFASLWLCPCLNPSGLAANTRENAGGIDLNRDYLDPRAEETLAHVSWLAKQPSFHVTLCLHEDWEAQGFYVYELNPDRLPSSAEPMVEAVKKVCPIDLSPMIEGREAANGIIRPTVDPLSRPQWPEAFYLLNHKTRRSYTLEAPSDYPLDTRVAALITGVRVVLDGLDGGGQAQ